MARSLSQPLTRFSTLSAPISSSSSSTNRLLKLRHNSSSPEVFSGEADETAAERVAMKKLEEAIHKIIVKRSEPDWIGFVPGASYWVPPKSKAQGLAQVIGKLIYDNNNSNKNNYNTNLIKGDKFSLSNRGWPSSTHFFKGASHTPLEGENTPKNTSKPEDEEG